MKRFFIITIALCCLLLSCKKNTNESMLGAAINYKLTDAYYIGGGLQKDPVNLNLNSEDSIISTCHKYDIFSLYATGVYKITNIDTSCNALDSASGTWIIKGNELLMIGKDTVSFLMDTDSTLIKSSAGILKPGDYLTEIYTQQ